MDEAGLLDAGDDLDLDVGLVAGPADEVLGVLGLAHRARGDGARSGADEMSATWRNRVSAAMPRSMASGASSFMSPPLEPRRTASFSSAITSKWPSSSKRATTRWMELVPMSTAARFSAMGQALIHASRSLGQLRQAVSQAVSPAARSMRRAAAATASP